MKRTNNFTLVEIIAVLLIIAIMAAVAAPKFISLSDDAKRGIAQAGVNEAKASLSVAYHKAYLAAGGVNTGITGQSVLTAAGFGDSPATVAFGDASVLMTADGTTITLVGSHGSVSTTGSNTWTVPVQ